MQHKCSVKNNPIAKLALALMFPMMLLLALYIQAHGEESPGGGFQAGAVLSSALTLYVLVRGLSSVRRLARWLRPMATLGVGIYVTMGMVPMFLGGAFLEYSALLSWLTKDSSMNTTGQKLGIFSIELGIAITVFSVFSLIINTILEECNADHRLD